MTNNTPAFGLQDIGRAVRRHKKKSTVTFLLVVIAAVTAAIFIPKSYHAEGMLLIRLGKENATLDPTVTAGPETVITVPMSRENELNSVVEILKSQAIAEKVVASLGPDYILGSTTSHGKTGLTTGADDQQKQSWQQSLANVLEKGKKWLAEFEKRPPMTEQQLAVAVLMPRCSISSTKHSDLIEIECKGPSPEWAQAVVGELMKAYQTEHFKLNRPRRSVEFFAEQMDRSLRELTAKQEAIRDLKTAGNVVSPADQRQAFALRVSRLEEELQQAQAAGTVSGRRIQVMRGQLKELPAELVESVTTGIGNEGTDQMRSQLFQLEVRKQEAAAKYTSDHPAMQALETQSQASRNVAVREEPTRTHVVKAPSRLYQEIDASLLQEEVQLAGSQAKQSALNEQLAVLHGQMKALNQQDLLLAGLERDIDVCQGAYRRFAAGYEQAKIDEARELQQISNIAVAQPATFEPEAVFPRKATFLGIGVMSGLLAAIAVALLAEARDRSFRDPEDVERRLGVSVLATIPHFAGRHLSTSGQRRV